jgi:hypothetical protein
MMYTRARPYEVFIDTDIGTPETSLIKEFLSYPVTRQELLTIVLLGFFFELLISTAVPWLRRQR